MASVALILLFTIIFLALIFDFINGFHDTANAIAASVSTGALTPRRAIMMAACLNFLGAVLVGTAVAKTIGKGIVDPAVATSWLVVAALLSAIAWNLITWYLGLPSSSSHALIGGIIGAGVASKGWGCLHWEGIAHIIESLIFSPLVGFGFAFFFMVALYWIFRKMRPNQVRTWLRYSQVLSAAFMSLSHGTNDAPKSMGMITMALLAAGYLKEFHVPYWVVVACAAAMGLGTSAGGWKIIKTMGSRIVKLQPIHGFAADMTSAIVITTASHFGLPVSTTHVVSSAIMGVGSTQRMSAVR
ncbi:MAG: anion permease, partial [Bacteroidota bacterium]